MIKQKWVRVGRRMGSAFSIELFLIVCRDQRTIILAIWRANLRSSTLPKMSASLPHVRQQTSTFISALSYNLQCGFFWQVVLGDPRRAKIIAMREGIRLLIVLVGILINLSEFEYRIKVGSEMIFFSMKISSSCQQGQRQHPPIKN